jgi:manganese oxidase
MRGGSGPYGDHDPPRVLGRSDGWRILVDGGDPAMARRDDWRILADGGAEGRAEVVGALAAARGGSRVLLDDHGRTRARGKTVRTRTRASGNVLPSLLLLVAAAGACDPGAAPLARAAAAPCSVDDASAARYALADDQRTRRGVLFRDTLDLQVDVLRAVLQPEGEQGPDVQIVTFAESGGAPTVPGPLVRASAGTTVLARVCNTLADTVWLLGLANRGDTIIVPPGHRVESVFPLDAQGIRVYRGVTREDTVMRPSGPSATLAGAIVTDGDEPWGDRVLVISEWAPTSTGDDFALFVNGRSWPHTERLHYEIGDTARWIVVNASPVEHPMHLHGFHFLVTARADASRDSVYAPGWRRLAVTELLGPDESMALEWVPERGGRWLFHCHIASHMDDAQRFMMGAAPPAPDDGHGGNHAERAMAGLVVGIEVSGDPVQGLAAGPPVHRERLIVNDRPDVYPDGDDGLGYVLQRRDEPAPDSIAVPGPPIVLTRGEPAEIAVVNRSAVATAVHWHGLEIESFFDGVPGWTGDARRTTPLIAPGDSFIVRLAPPRAGTFIYHSHADELRQLGSGLFGPVVVLEPGEAFDPTTDHFLIFSMAGPNLDIAPIVANNGAEPALELAAGRSHRIRIINITAEDRVAMEIRDENGPIPWRILALDGADVPPAHATEHPALLLTGPGETVDVVITPQAGDLRLLVRAFNDFESTIRVIPGG